MKIKKKKKSWKHNNITQWFKVNWNIFYQQFENNSKFGWQLASLRRVVFRFVCKIVSYSAEPAIHWIVWWLLNRQQRHSTKCEENRKDCMIILLQYFTVAALASAVHINFWKKNFIKQKDMCTYDMHVIFFFYLRACARCFLRKTQTVRMDQLMISETHPKCVCFEPMTAHNTFVSFVYDLLSKKSATSQKFSVSFMLSFVRLSFFFVP